MGRIILVTGGARCGKSEFAEKFAKTMNEDVAYIATAKAEDEEMKERINKHQKRRLPFKWETIEAPYEAEKAIASCEKPMIIFDCLTVYLSNLLLKDEIKNLPFNKQEEIVMNAFAYLNEAASARTGETIFVTNEVGAGIVPENEIARRYRDLAGLVNQQMANVAHMVFYVVSGIPMQIK